jgi:branched-chain amino acid transport system ATP-binding protein
MLKIEGISASYGELKVLHDISQEVADGETVVTVGPNGAGKTTLLRVISGVLKPSSGAIYFDGQRLDGKEPYEIVDMGISIVPEGGRLFPGLTVYDNLKAGSYTKRSRGELKQSLAEIFSNFPILKERQNQIAGSLSGGERQMLAIARTLMSRPKLVMLDEVSSGLAPKIVTDLFELVKAIKSQGYSILMVEQNVKKALELADHAYLMESGRLQLHGTKEDFIQSPHIKKAYLGI